MLVCTVLGMVIERLAYKPLRAAPSLAVLITAIGVSYFLQNAALLLWSSSPKVCSQLLIKSASGEPGTALRRRAALFRMSTLVTIAVCVVIMVALTLFIGKTKMGKAMRACSEDKGAAQLMGINVNTHDLRDLRHRLRPWRRLRACCCAPPILRSMPTTGSMPGIKAFTAAVFGGIGSIPGALLGGHAAGRHRDLGQGVYLHPAVGRHRVRGSDRRAAGQAGGPAGQADPRESVRWRR